MFAGGPVSDARNATLVGDLNGHAVHDLEDRDPTVVLQRNEPRHGLNTCLLRRQAVRRGKRLVVWNANHVPIKERGGP